MTPLEKADPSLDTVRDFGGGVVLTDAQQRTEEEGTLSSMSMLESMGSARMAGVRPETSTRAFSIVRREGPWRDALRRRMLATADLIAAAIATVAAVGLGDGSSLLWCLAALPGWILLAKLHGLYDRDHRVLRHLTVDELPALATWALTGAALFVVIGVGAGDQTVDAVVGVKLWVALVAGAVVLRTAARGLWRWIVPPERALLVGSGALETATLRKLELFEDIHVCCVAVISDSESDDDTPAGVAFERRLNELGGIDRVIVASMNVTEPLIAEHVLLCRRYGLKLSVVPPARGMFGTAVLLHHIADLPMIEYSTWDVGRSNILLKRVLDVFAAGLLVVLLAPLMLALALGVRLTSSGPALFVQRRAGIGGRPFRMLKFRTMVADAEVRLGEVVSFDELDDPMFKLRRDPRVTPFGAFLRRTSLDELPQLFNVLAGSMSLVGPRPEQLELVDRYSAEHRFRLQTKPGITGPMQVYGRGELRFDERLAVEREYVENLTLRRDVRLLLLTVATVIRGRGAF